MVNDLTKLYILIKRFEGCRLTPYLCPAGVWTCGWGSTGAGVFPGEPWTQEYADERMQRDAKRFALKTLILCPNLKKEQLCAIADFAYNVGLNNFKNSTLRLKINANQSSEVGKELFKWVFAGGKKLNGLLRRRQAEYDLYISG